MGDREGGFMLAAIVVGVGFVVFGGAILGAYLWREATKFDLDLGSFTRGEWYEEED